ncbi:MAG: InlB B-repeat-containing protein [Treponemataceae bacterium]
MLEFLNNGKVENCFTFSVPPESEELQFTHRLSETKSFGGSFFDGYGNDSVKITLSGTTINEEKKFIYRGKLAPQYLTGEREIFEIQKIITQWNKIDIDKGDKKVYLYDLSKMSLLQTISGTASKNYWRVFIKDLKIKRDKSSPNKYNYTLEMQGVDDEEKGKTGFFDESGFTSIVNNITETMEKVQTVIDTVEGSVALVQEITTKTKEVINSFEDMQGASPYKITSSITRGFDSALRILTGNSNNSFFNTAKNLLIISEQFFDQAIDSSFYEQKQSSVEDTQYFIVDFNSNGGSSVKFQKILYCNRVEKPSMPTKEDHIFSSWFTDFQLDQEYDFSTEVTKSFTLHAKWILSVATVRFNSKGGGILPNQKISIGDNVQKPTDPTRKGYLFGKWCIDFDAVEPFDFDTKITEDITLYASWIKVCVVSFDTDGGSIVDDQIIAVGEKVIYPLTPNKDNFTFTNWYKDSKKTELFDFNTNVLKDLTLFADYYRTSNTVFFESNGGSIVDDQIVIIGDKVQKPIDPAKEGFAFDYWCSDQTLTNEFNFNNVIIDSNTILYARWTSISFSITFNTNEGSDIPTSNVQYGSRVVFPEIPKKDGFIFNKWCTDELCTNEYDFSEKITENKVLYAKWERIG